MLTTELWIGLVLGAAIAVFAMWLRSKGIVVKWYEYLIGALAVLLGMATPFHYFGSLAEYEPTAGWMGSAIFAGLAIILAAVVWQLVWRRHRAAA